MGPRSGSTVLQNANQALVLLLALVLISAWAIFTGEPIVRFWLASNRAIRTAKPRLRKRRLVLLDRSHALGDADPLQTSGD